MAQTCVINDPDKEKNYVVALLLAKAASTLNLTPLQLASASCSQMKGLDDSTKLTIKHYSIEMLNYLNRTSKFPITFSSTAKNEHAYNSFVFLYAECAMFLILNNLTHKKNY